MEMDKFKEDLKQLGKRVISLKANIGTEEATKTSLIMPFFNALGYDIFNPTEFVPEFTADVGIKKAEKVDYAVVLDGSPMILVEAKVVSEPLINHDSQLFRYFGTTNSKFGILTNGQEYKFYTDLDAENKMDLTPFLTVDITKIKDNQFPELAKFHKDNFDVEKIINSASELKYLSSIKTFLSEQVEEPTEEFTKYLLSEIYDGVKTKQTIDKFLPIVKKGLNQFISEKVNDKLSAALKSSVSIDDTPVPPANDDEEKTEKSDIVRGIVTTPEELETFTIVKIILKDAIDLERLYYRDNKSYFNILMDDNNRRWIIRVHINSSSKKIELNNDDKSVFEFTNPIDILSFQDAIVAVAQKFI